MHFKASLVPCVILTDTGVFRVTDKSPKKGLSLLRKVPQRTQACSPFERFEQTLLERW